jgi:ribonuclease J
MVLNLGGIMEDKKINTTPTYIYAMGGLEEIGKNTYVFEHDDEIIIADAGVKFASEDLLGINAIIPSFD